MSATQPKSEFILRPLNAEDREAYAEMLYRSFNTWYVRHGWDGDYFRCAPSETSGRFRGGAALLAVPMERRHVVEALYDWGARNVETHLFQVRGQFQPFAGVNLPSFLPETG